MLPKGPYFCRMGNPIALLSKSAFLLVISYLKYLAHDPPFSVTALTRNLSTGKIFNLAAPYLSSGGASRDCLSEPLPGAQWRKKLHILKNPCSI
jgi:hypothetical protein